MSEFNVNDSPFAANAEAVRPWIYTEDQMPEEDVPVLACWERLDRATNTVFRFLDILVWGRYRWENSDGRTPNGTVTAWQALPKLPERRGK